MHRNPHLPSRKAGPTVPVFFDATKHAIQQSKVRPSRACFFVQRKGGRA